MSVVCRIQFCQDFRTSRLSIFWSLCRQTLLACRLLLVPLHFGSRLRAATGNFETRANTNCTHRSCEVCCCAHNNHRLCKQTASYACEACSCLAGFIRSLSCHSPFACSAPRRKYDLSCSDIVYRHKTSSNKNDRNETRFRAQSPKRKRHKPYVAPNVPLPRIRAAIQARIPASKSGPFRIDTCNRDQPHGVQGAQPITQARYLVEPKHNIRQQ